MIRLVEAFLCLWTPIVDLKLPHALSLGQIYEPLSAETAHTLQFVL